MNSTHNTEKFIEIWNSIFSTNITTADLKQPQSVINCLTLIIKRLNIDLDVLVKPLSEEENTENTEYYVHLRPIINLTKIINHIIKPQPKFTIAALLQPTPQTSYAILMYLFNYMLFVEQEAAQVKPFEDKVYEKHEMITILADKIKELNQSRNNYAMKKGERETRMQKMREEEAQLEEEIKEEKALLDAEMKDYEVIALKNQKVQKSVDGLTNQRDKILADIEKHKLQIVCDADDVKKQDKEMVQDIGDVEKLCNTQSEALTEKENSINILQSVKQLFQNANDYLLEIMDIVESIKESENDRDSEDLKLLTAKLSELVLQHNDLQSTRAEAKKKRQEVIQKRQQIKVTKESEIQVLTIKFKELKEMSEANIVMVKKIEQALKEDKKSEILFLQRPEEIRIELIFKIKSLSNEVSEVLKCFGDSVKKNFK